MEKKLVMKTIGNTMKNNGEKVGNVHYRKHDEKNGEALVINTIGNKIKKWKKGS